MYRWSVQGPSASFTSSLGILAVVGMGAHLLQNDPNFTTGKFFAFLLYANIFYEPVRQLVSINNLVSAGKASGERVFEILDEPIRIQNPPEPIAAFDFSPSHFHMGAGEILLKILILKFPTKALPL